MRQVKWSKNSCKNNSLSPFHILCLFLGSISFVSFLVSVSGLFLLQSLPALLNLLCSVQLIFSILLHIHMSKASSLFIYSFLVAHVCDPYSMTPHSIGFYHPFLRIPVYFPLRSSFHIENVSFPVTILLLI